MTDDQKTKYNAMVERINAMGWEAIEALVKSDECPFEPEHLIGVPLGQFHCPVCGEMVLAGVRHPRYGAISRDAIMRERDRLDKIKL